MMVSQSIPLSLYIHIPWCIRKCPYCDFNSHKAADDGIPEQQYIAALLKDLEQILPRVWGRRISTLFFGGGTPSLLSAAAIADLLSGIRARIPLLPTAEITLEANPGSLEIEKFQQFRDAGINRISIGVQSFNDKHLQLLGRIHNSDQAHRAIEVVKNCGFNSYNIDLMFGLPEQNAGESLYDMEQAVRYQPPHLSLYQLTLEENTPFHHNPPKDMPDDDVRADMQDALIVSAGGAGLARYEVSAYSKHGQQCQHNINYWSFGDYIGIGAGAHSKITDQNSITRYSRPRLPKEYLKQSDTSFSFVAERQLTKDDIVIEYMMNALRLKSGFKLDDFTRNTGLTTDIIAPKIAEAVELGLMVEGDEKYYPSDHGFNFLSDLQMIFS